MKTASERKQPARRGRKKESLEERIHRHINDINSVITEDDIKNVNTEPTGNAETVSSEQPETKKSGKRGNAKQKKENEIDKSDAQTTPWNLLSEGYD